MIKTDTQLKQHIEEELRWGPKISHRGRKSFPTTQNLGSTNIPTIATPEFGSCFAAPTVFKAAAMLTLLMGAVLHSLDIILGKQRFLRDVFSPQVEVVFSGLMIIASTAGWMSWRHFTGSRWMRVVYGFSLVLITLSIPIHVRSVVIWSTGWVGSFPKYYSQVEGPMFFALMVLVSRMRFHGPARAVTTGQRSFE
jgi:hypothetical protein